MKRIFIFFMGIAISFSTVIAQNNVKGKVTDAESNEPLYGANVIVEGKNNGTTTDANGLFELHSINENEVVITVSYIGYGSESKTVKLDGKMKSIIEFGLYKKEIQTDQVFITASKHEQSIDEVPGRVELISQRMMKSTPANSIDDLFKNVAGVYVDRSYGIFDHKAVVNIRGVTSSEQGRVLALVDGMPINKSDGGTVTWNRINPNDIERVEIFKGPGSSIYGSNAMGGVVNFITKKSALQSAELNAAVKYGTYNTYELSAGVDGSLSGVDGLYYRASFFNRKSDGYVSLREEFVDDYTIKSRMKETGVNGKLGYHFNNNTSLELNYNFYDDLRGSGVQVEKENYMTHKTNFASMMFNTTISNVELKANAYYQIENYLRVNEKYKIKNGALSSYDRYNVDADRTDLGASINAFMPIASHSLVAGVEYKMGGIDGSDVYETSTDVVTNKGDMNFFSAFVQDEFKIIDPLKIVAGVRIDNVQFKNGEFTLTNPTSTTDFMEDFAGKLEDYNWTSVTPKISAQYKFAENFKMYAAYSQGFRAASLDDLTRSGFISGGFKVANPELQPERIDNYELGFNYDMNKTLFIMPSVYYMKGRDYMSYIATGETVLGGKKKVLKKDNITEVSIFGGDIDVKYFMNSNIYLFGNYTYTKTEILSYTGSEELVGKELVYTPNHLANLGVTYLNPYLNFSANMHYQSEQFLSDDNEREDEDGYSQMIEASLRIDLKAWKNLGNGLILSVDIQDLFNEQVPSSYDTITPGRMVFVGLSYGL